MMDSVLVINDVACHVVEIPIYSLGTTSLLRVEMWTVLSYSST